MKRLSQLAAVVTTGLTLLSTPTVFAQESPSVIFNEIQDNINLSHESVAASGTIELSIANRDVAADLFRFEFGGNLGINPVAGEMEGSFLTAFFAFDFNWLVDDEDFYVYQNYDQGWTHEVYDTAYFEEYLANYQENFFNHWLTNEDIAPVIDKYVTYSNENGQHIFRLNSDIDGAEFYQDLDEAIDIDQTIMEQAQEARELADDENSQMTDEEFDAYVQMSLEELTPENFSLFFNMGPEYQVAFNQETYDLEHVTFGLLIDSSIWENELAPSEFFFVPQDIDFSFELNLSNHGEEFEVNIPQEALDTPVDEGGDIVY